MDATGAAKPSILEVEAMNRRRVTTRFLSRKTISHDRGRGKSRPPDRLDYRIPDGSIQPEGHRNAVAAA
jgi:hypothetical protein